MLGVEAARIGNAAAVIRSRLGRGYVPCFFGQGMQFVGTACSGRRGGRVARVTSEGNKGSERRGRAVGLISHM
jgi:hypothetical protein